ncbi:RHS repeat-associated core domain-containing protein [Luteibacter sp. UNCMF331Sha3.1]|uniref:RHS repeat domain-containing protein n=1 Tax=Luteibacter sp. UNCMF331Sha3.1 TaxID=1502760 RepID=UPI001FCD4E82|nr:RHS repeat-associated core domain-containing protein [Luteibacter sp. UNCMF331Sha3.1]
MITEADEDELPRDEAGNAYVAQSFTYDAVDNLVAVRTELHGGEVDVATYEYDDTERDRLLGIVHARPEYGPPVRLAYDDDGNIADDGRGRAYRWDGAGRLESVTRANGTWQYRHGPGGRICAIVHDGHILFRYHEDGGLVAELSSTEERRYIRCGANVVAETRLAAAIRQTWLLVGDAQGTVLVEAGDGAPRTRTYDAFGARDTSTDAAQSGFTGESLERASHCHLLGNRLYSPVLRRFLNPDPLSPLGPAGFNRYAYCGGDPVNRVDPSGNSWLPIFFSALGLAAAVIGAVVSVGALSGAVAAAGGGLTMLLSTPSMVAATAAATLDAVSVIAEAASLTALATGEDGLATMFGALAFGSGIASAGLSVLTHAVSRSARFVGFAGTSRGSGRPGISMHPMGGASSSMRHAESPREFTFMQEHEIARERLSIHPSKPEWVVEPIFHTFRHPANRLSMHHFVDSVVYNDMISRAAELIRGNPLRRKKTAVYVYAGVHGEYKKPNFGPQMRNSSPVDDELLDEQRYWFRELQNMLGENYEVFPENVGKMSRDAYRNAMERTGHHLHWFCYSLADNVAIAEIGIPANIPLTVYPVPTGP